MQKILFFLTFIISASTLKAQTAEDSVKAVINKLFTAFKNSDAVAMKSTFADSAILQTFLVKDGTTVIESEKVDAFAQSISKLSKGDADERIVFDVIKINGPLAMVWAPYKFYYKGAFSHCGVDSFQLVKVNGEWKIQYLVDTRTRKGCD
jgi:ketosteroid isomerase-like protein